MCKFFKNSYVCILMMLFSNVFSQNYWKTTSQQAFILNEPKLEKALETNHQRTLSLPLPEGGFENFEFEDASILPQKLREKYNQIICLEGVSTQNKNKTATLTFYKGSLYGMIRSNNDLINITPLDSSRYKVERVEKITLETHNCASNEKSILTNTPARRMSENSSTSQLKNYTLVVATTGEYTSYHGGTIPDALAAIVTTLNRVNSIYKVELGINLVLSEETDKVIYTDPETDPFNNSNAGSILNVVQDLMDNEIGEENYDVGHVFSTGAGGLADLRAVCSSYKASGVTGTKSPIGDAYDVDFVSHELGHQFGANHTFNGTSGFCNGNESNTRYEPGSGSTIMGYAGLCNIDNLQQNSNAYFHIKSIEEIREYITYGTGSTCGYFSEDINHHPEIISQTTSNYSIPISTPFILDGKATDQDPTDYLSYNWEQVDQGPSGSLGNPTGNAPLFRSYEPDSLTYRYFPKLKNIVDASPSTSEVLPSYTRSMNFSFNVRDQKGGLDYQTTSISVSESAGPFTVSYPNENITFVFNDEVNILWDVANTDNEIINCQSVSILLSTDGGNTFEDTLIANTPNDGNENIIIPALASTKCRIMVIATDNIFLDVTDADFTISEPEYAYFLPKVTFSQKHFCAESDALEISLGADVYSGFTDSIDFEILLDNSLVFSSDLNGKFSPNEIYSVILASNPTSENKYLPIQISFHSDTISHIFTDSLLIYNTPIPSPALLETPLDNQQLVGLNPILEWNSQPFLKHLVTITDTDENIVFTSNIVNKNSVQAINLPQNTDLNWNITSSSHCGENISSTAQFTTGGEICFQATANDLPLLLSEGRSVFRDTLFVASKGEITQVSLLNLAGPHEWISDLSFELQHPNKSSYLLLSNPCFDDYGEDFDLNIIDNPSLDRAPCPPSDGGNYKPYDSFDPMIATQAHGKWVLKIEDFYPDLDEGALNSWELEICVSEASYNGAPDLVNNQPSSLSLGTYNPTPISPSNLLAYDDATQTDNITFVITSISEGIEILNENTRLNIGDSFFQNELQTNKINAKLLDTLINNSFGFTLHNNQGMVSDTFHHYFAFDGTITSLNKQIKQTFHLLPNPVTTYMTIDDGYIGAIEIYTLLGVSIRKEELLASQRIDLSTLAPGIYLVHIENGQIFRLEKR